METARRMRGGRAAIDGRESRGGLHVPDMPALAKKLRIDSAYGTSMSSSHAIGSEPEPSKAI